MNKRRNKHGSSTANKPERGSCDGTRGSLGERHAVGKPRRCGCLCASAERCRARSSSCHRLRCHQTRIKRERCGGCLAGCSVGHSPEAAYLGRNPAYRALAAGHRALQGARPRPQKQATGDGSRRDHGGDPAEPRAGALAFRIGRRVFWKFCRPASGRFCRPSTLDGVTIREAAQRLRMSEGAVRVALHRGLTSTGREVWRIGVKTEQSHSRAHNGSCRAGRRAKQRRMQPHGSSRRSWHPSMLVGAVIILFLAPSPHLAHGPNLTTAVTLVAASRA